MIRNNRYEDLKELYRRGKLLEIQEDELFDILAERGELEQWLDDDRLPLPSLLSEQEQGAVVDKELLKSFAEPAISIEFGDAPEYDKEKLYVGVTGSRLLRAVSLAAAIAAVVVFMLVAPKFWVEDALPQQDANYSNTELLEIPIVFPKEEEKGDESYDTKEIDTPKEEEILPNKPYVAETKSKSSAAKSATIKPVEVVVAEVVAEPKEEMIEDLEKETSGHKFSLREDIERSEKKINEIVLSSSASIWKASAREEEEEAQEVQIKPDDIIIAHEQWDSKKKISIRALSRNKSEIR